jgi:two-component system chemotaxis sensor kinase CheA
MNPLLEQFLSEARDFLQDIAEKLMQLEDDPSSTQMMNELFRLVHTLKGNSGLFEFPEMTRVLHAGEDLLDAVRDGRVNYSQELADRLLDAMDFVNLLVDEVELKGSTGAGHAHNAVRLAESLRQLIGSVSSSNAAPVASTVVITDPPNVDSDRPELPGLIAVPEQQRMDLYRSAVQGTELLFVEFSPEAECFFKGEDPFFQARQIPDTVWHSVEAREPWPALPDLDAYHCNLVFRAVTTALAEELYELFRYTPEQVRIMPLPAAVLVLPQGDTNGGPVYDDFIADALAFLDADDVAGLKASVRVMLALSAPSQWLASALTWLLLVLENEPDNREAQRNLLASLHTLTPPLWATTACATDSNPTVEPAMATEKEAETEIELETEIIVEQGLVLSDAETRAYDSILQAQREIIAQPDNDQWLSGRLTAVATALKACHRMKSLSDEVPGLDDALALALETATAAPLRDWLEAYAPQEPVVVPMGVVLLTEATELVTAAAPAPTINETIDPGSNVQFGRRTEDAYTGPKTLKVDQEKIDLLMGLIGEMVVAKNSLPYLAVKAETQYGVRELAREIKSQYAVINRIAEEMQDAIMQVRMMPVSFIFQRFPRLVRDTSRKLSKEVNLFLEGENTEVDKNIVEALADPFIHIVRNSLDHGIETPELRRAAGKPEAGRLTIRASQESDRVYIDISDDGKGIDPTVIKNKAYEKGIIDEAMLDRLTDQEALNLVFAAGFSTAEVISDLSGRGVGMDVVRNAVEKVNGTVSLDSEVGKGTRIRLSLPLSMAVTNVILVESNKQVFGVPMDMVVETVRVPRTAIHTIKRRLTTVLRGRIVPLMALNDLLALNAEQVANADDMLAMLVVRINDEQLGILVDDFRETVDIILKPMVGIIGGLGGYAGSALLGDGSVLMVLNPKELV